VTRLRAALYDPLVARDAQLRRERAELLSAATGKVLEVGAGTGLNASFYPAEVDVTFAEPDPHMAKRIDADVVEAPAEALPFADASFDTVVSTLVLCSVDDLERALAEIRRVLTPDGRLLFLEHVRAREGSSLARWQDRLNPLWRRLAGCDCNRDTVAAMQTAGFTVTARPTKLAPPLARPVVSGVATTAS
jgi:ubiquinone/menaquinone biosynthesis C-methylase UbiE